MNQHLNPDTIAAPLKPLEQAVGYFGHHGWFMAGKPLTARADVMKTFDTAVGPKDAFVLIHLRDGEIGLHGYYQSEGRNILESSTLYVEVSKGPDAMRDCVARFVRDAEERIANSYAAKLLRRPAMRMG